MYFGLDVPTTGAYADPRRLAQLAAEAEAAGWDGFFIWDLLSSDDPVVDPWIALTAIALNSHAIKLGLMVTPLARHRPWLVARRLANLDHLSGGRIICTVGLGHDAKDFVPFGEGDDPRRRAQQLDEGLAVLAGLWEQESFSYEGNHYRLEQLSLYPKPLQSPRIPLWVAGGWPHRAPFRRAARWDGVVFKSIDQKSQSWLTEEAFRAGLAYVRAQRSSQSPFEVIISGDSSGDRQEAVARVRAFQQAGATWWVEEGLGWSFEEFQQHIRRGPPRP